MKLVYTFYVGPSNNHNGAYCGYRNSEDLLDSLLLSSTISGRHFTACELYCNRRAWQLIQQDGRAFPFTNVIACLDELDDWLLLHNWAYPKIVTYSLQREPFVHLDYDAILSDGLPPALLAKPFVFQQKECITPLKYTYYTKLFDEAQQLGLLPTTITSCPQFAMNMGLFACTQPDALPIVQQYCQMAFDYVRQQQAAYDQVLLKHEQPMLFEQLFIVSALLNNELADGVDFGTFIDTNNTNPYLPTYRFSHFYSDWKRKNMIVVAIKKELMRLGLQKRPIMQPQTIV
jgi:hypothetical protein